MYIDVYLYVSNGIIILKYNNIITSRIAYHIVRYPYVWLQHQLLVIYYATYAYIWYIYTGEQYMARNYNTMQHIMVYYYVFRYKNTQKCTHGFSVNAE